MPVPARLYAPGREEIVTRDDWAAYAPAALGQADAWLRTGSPALPDELAAALPDCDAVNARPAHAGLDVFACLKRGGETIFVAGVTTGDGEAATRAEAEARGVAGWAVLRPDGTAVARS